ncbi:MAG: pyruvate kinase [Nitrospinae bacterium]|nr:pyruvate kinase [Nitrospinota bacterium]
MNVENKAVLKKTKIICTLGPACDNPRTIRGLIEQGANIFRINCSHTDEAGIRRLVRMVRKVAKNLASPIGVMIDLQGPKIRVGEFYDQTMKLVRGEIVSMKVTKEMSDGSFIPVQYEGFYDDVGHDGRILLDDGKICMEVVSKKNGVVKARVVFGGVLSNKKGINLPDSTITAAPTTKKDLEYLKVGLDEGVDFVAMSFVSKAEEVLEMKSVIARHDHTTAVVAKIERHEAVKNLESIVEVSDAVMIARGDLGVEMPLSMVPVIQRKIIHACHHMAKPVIVATQMMESMISNPRPSRADVSDVSGAVHAYADALMLSGETSTGSFPTECVAEMRKTALEMENYQKAQAKTRYWEMGKRIPEQSEAIAKAGVSLAELLNLKGIVVVTKSGWMVKQMAALHPVLPIYAFTPHEVSMRQLALVRGVFPFCLKFKKEFSYNIPEMLRECKKRGFLTKGDRVVVVAGVKAGNVDGTNTVRVETVL